ncbi:MAG: hypothetical protein WD824_26885 [Cyclobacteriaceae bacterium]
MNKNSPVITFPLFPSLQITDTLLQLGRVSDKEQNSVALLYTDDFPVAYLNVRDFVKLVLNKNAYRFFLLRHCY